MRWPRGRYNGQRIVGVRFTFAIDVTTWMWKPQIGCYCGACHWLCFRSWTAFEYEQFERSVRKGTL